MTRFAHEEAVIPSSKRSEVILSSTAVTPAARTALPPVLWALLFGNFVIGTGVMVVPGTLNEISGSLAVSVATAGQPGCSCRAAWTGCPPPVAPAC